MPDIYKKQLTLLQKTQKQAIAQHQLSNGETVWVRRADTHHSIWVYHVMGVVTKLLSSKALIPVPSLGGIEAINNEAAALQRFEQANIIAPRLLAKTATALMMSDLGGATSLLSALEKQHAINQEIFLQTWLIGARAIAEAHQKNQYFSQCFSRNMMIFSNNEIGFIDFEDNPASVLSIELCQIRDWLCYLHSTAFLLNNETLRIQAAKELNFILRNSSSTVKALQKNTRFFTWIRHFRHKRWGRDTLRIAALMRFLAVCSRVSM